MAGRPTARALRDGSWASLHAVWSGGKQVGLEGAEVGQWDGRIDPLRGWVIAACWLAASTAEYVSPYDSLHEHITNHWKWCLTANSIYVLYALIRRPRLILDFALTLLFNHLVLTSYYSSALPTSWFFWVVMIGGTCLMVIVSEQLCVKREMTEGLAVASTTNDADEVEMGGLLRRD